MGCWKSPDCIYWRGTFSQFSCSSALSLSCSVSCGSPSQLPVVFEYARTLYHLLSSETWVTPWNLWKLDEWYILEDCQLASPSHHVFLWRLNAWNHIYCHFRCCEWVVEWALYYILSYIVNGKLYWHLRVSIKVAVPFLSGIWWCMKWGWGLALSRPLVGFSALHYLECFDTVGWMTQMAPSH